MREQIKQRTWTALALGLVLGVPCGFAADAIVSGRVVDADTGQPVPCTVAIRGGDGKVIADHPSFRGGIRSNGVFEKAVPPGNVTVAVSRGFDYSAAVETVGIREGERRELKFALRRRTPLRRLGWYCGDNHVHMIHGERKIAIDFSYAAAAARAEGLDYLALCQQWDLPQITPEALDAACRRASTSDFILTWNLEAQKTTGSAMSQSARGTAGPWGCAGGPRTGRTRSPNCWP